jgi:hydroxyethylthiazole kinase-like uncharacterized protein yjeF
MNMSPQELMSGAQWKDWDAFTMFEYNIPGVELMETAALAFVQKFVELFPDRYQKICIVAGLGNNGGDALAIARILVQTDYQNILLLVADHLVSNASEEYRLNFERLPQVTSLNVQKWSTYNFQLIENGKCILIDGLLGYGFKPPLREPFIQLIDKINTIQWAGVISIDVPSGLDIDQIEQTGSIIKAHFTMTFQQLKFAFLFQTNYKYTGKIQVLDIGLSRNFQTASKYFLVTTPWIKTILIEPYPWAQKYQQGVLSILAGSAQYPGAAQLSCLGALSSGVGLTCLLKFTSMELAYFSNLPEIVFSTENAPHPKSSAVLVGPGLSRSNEAFNQFKAFLSNSVAYPAVIDADGMIMLFKHNLPVPEKCIFTPHIGEFDFLFGPFENEGERLNAVKLKAIQYNCIFVLKGKYTLTVLPDGNIFFNTSGNEALARGGTGDVLAGLIAGLLAKGYSCADAAVLGVYIHGLAADIYTEKKCAESLRPSELIKYIGKAFNTLKNER